MEKLLHIIDTNLVVILKNLGLAIGFLVGIGLNYDAAKVLFVLMMADLIFGVADSVVTQGWRSITSARFGRGILAKAMILSLPGLLLLAAFGAGHDFSQFTNGFMTALIFSEFYSIVGHVVSVQTGKRVKEFDAISFVLKRLQSALKNIITDEKAPDK